VIGDIRECIKEGGLTRRHAQSADAALKLGDALFKHGICRIADAAISIAFDFKVEQCGCVIRAIKFISDGLIDRNRDRLCRGIIIKAPCTAIVSLRIHAPFSKVSRSARPRRRQTTLLLNARLLSLMDSDYQ